LLPEAGPPLLPPGSPPQPIIGNQRANPPNAEAVRVPPGPPIVIRNRDRSGVITSEPQVAHTAPVMRGKAH
jgi:hypothetical protein